MMKRKLYLMGVLCVLANIKSFSQTGGLSLSQAWEIAFAGYPGLLEKEALIKEAHYGRKEVANGFLPNVQAQLQNSYGTFNGSSGAFFPLPGIFNVNGINSHISEETVTSNAFGSLLFDWKVFEFGRQRKAIGAADARIGEAVSSFDASKLSLQREVAARYTDVLYDGEKRRWAADNVLRVKQILAVTNELAEAGLKPAADTLLASSSYLQTLGELDDQSGKFAASKIRLTQFAPLDTALIRGYSPAFLSPAVLPGYSDSVSQSHPYLRVVGNQVEHAQLRAELASRKILPTFSILGGVSTRSSGISADGSVQTEWPSVFKNQRKNYLIGVGLTWNISDAFNSITEKNRIKQQQRVSRLKYAMQALQANTNLIAARTRVNELMKQTFKTSAAVRSARDAYDLYLSRYENGLINLSELLQIQLLLQQAEKVNIEAHGEYWKHVIIYSELSADFTYLSIQFN